jgi:hypothetical protein
MTKPECSKKEPTREKTKTKTDSPEKDSKLTNPATAKDLFSVFAPEESDNDEVDIEKRDDKKDENYEPACKKSKDNNSKRYIPKYKKEWENKPELKSWLSESIHGNTYFYCKFCKKDYRCGISDIHKHMSSKKHMLRATVPAFEAQKFKFRGLLCPVFTPFVNTRRVTPDINLEAIPKYARFLNACEVKGILGNDINKKIRSQRSIFSQRHHRRGHVLDDPRTHKRDGRLDRRLREAQPLPDGPDRRGPPQRRHRTGKPPPPSRTRL